MQIYLRLNEAPTFPSLILDKGNKPRERRSQVATSCTMTQLHSCVYSSFFISFELLIFLLSCSTRTNQYTKIAPSLLTTIYTHINPKLRHLSQYSDESAPKKTSVSLIEENSQFNMVSYIRRRSGLKEAGSGRLRSTTFLNLVKYGLNGT